MLHNYLIMALRNLRKQALYSFINIIGLAVGIACCLIILLFVYDELSYDDYHEHADSIYRVSREWLNDGEPSLRLARISAPIAPALEAEFPDVLHAVRVWGNGGLISRENEYVSEPRVYFAEEDFFKVFTVPLVEGDAETALVEPFTLALTQSMAEKYFGDEDPMGQVLRLDDEWDLRVTGVLEDLPHKTHLPFDFLVSFATLEAVFPADAFTNWRGNNSFGTYVRLSEGTDPDVVEARLPEFLESHYTQDAEAPSRLFLQPITDIHLYSDLDTEFEANGDIAYVYLFSAVAFFILLIACFNFMSLSTARASRREKEIGVRKVMGATRRQLAGQFLGETMLLAICALVVAGILAQLLIPLFNDLSGKELELSGGRTFLSLAGLTVISLIAGLIAGSYPAFYLSAFRPAAVLKGAVRTGGRSPRFQTAVVVAQFAISIVLVVGTLVVFRQLQFVQSKDLGFEREQLLVLPGSDSIIDRFASVREQLTSHPGIQSVTASRLVPSDPLLDHIDGTVQLNGDAVSFSALPLLPVDHDFVTTYGIDLVAGRSFSVDRPTDSTEAFILNESAVRRLGWPSPEEAIGKRVTLGGSLMRTGYVVGVIEDFHFESLKENISPLLLFIMPDRHRLITVRLTGQDVPRALDFLEDRWAEFLPNFPFTYRLIDTDFDQLYQGEEQLGSVVGTFGVLAIFIACLGLFGLAAFTAQQRTKEIGIRKVLGASVAGIVGLLSRDFVRLVVIAAVIAAPIGYFLMSEWLESFAYRIDIGVDVFVLATILGIVTALATVSYQSARAALADPVKSLRWE